ncbi:hypothetical protein E4G67_02700 [Candidatus Bathyarchaeota archaeon]|nr:MAG: hypothetical protein E4G67_02700 [Candidatus Bathyarchaeota archaeon]
MTIYKLTNPPSAYYASRTLQWCWCSKPTTGKVRATGTWSNCRETVAMDIKRDVLSNKSKFGLDLKTARILCQISVGSKVGEVGLETIKKQFANKMQRAVNFLNILEAKHDWVLTKLHELKFSIEYDYGAQNIVCMFTGSRKWLRSPHMVSLWLLLLRTGSHKLLWNPKSYADLKKKTTRYLEKTTSTDALYMRVSFPHWNKIMANHVKLFKGFPIERNFNPKKAWNGFDVGNEGIRKLCDGSSLDQDLVARFLEICK